MQSSHTLERLDIVFDDTHTVAAAGLLLPATVVERLGIEQAADQLIDLGPWPGAAHPGAKVLTLVHGILAGGDCIDDVDVLRCGSTATVLGHRVLAPSTVGTFLRGFTFGHTRQLDRLTEQILGRAWAAGAGPGDGPMTIDADSTIVEVYGHHKQGAAYGYTHTLGYHPLLATRRVLPSTATARHHAGWGGDGCWSASHRPITRSSASGSTRARTRRTVASPGGRQTRRSASRRTPSAAKTGPGASPAHSPIATRDLAPASTAATATASTALSGCRRPRRCVDR
jgi:Transposase DDE domain group 1